MTNVENFFQLHHQPKPLILANAWNVMSAQVIENTGFDAIGTSSGAIASSLGYADGEKIPFDELFLIIKRIKASTNIPLSVDMERGYTDDLSKLKDYIQSFIDIGVSGINLEDAQGEEIFLNKLDCIKNYLIKSNQKLFINARTDVYLQKLPSPFETTLKRAALYHEAGADGLFVTAVSEEGTIRELASAIQLPLNVVGTPKISSIEALTNCKVKRISMAVFLYKATYNELEKVCKRILKENSFGPLF